MMSFVGIGIFVLSLAAIVSLWLIITGYRGQRIDDHPTCRKCHYDLTGIIDSPEQSDSTCPECGNDLTAKHSVRYGNRRRRPLRTACGITLMVCLLSLLGTRTAARIHGIQVQHYKPVWMLHNELVSSNPYVRELAFIEFNRRTRAGTLTQSELDPVIKLLLKQHTNPKIPWKVIYDLLLIEAHHQNLIDPVDWQRYIEHTVMTGFELWVRPRVKRNACIPLRFRGTASRFSAHGYTLRVRTRGITIEQRREPISFRMSFGYLKSDDPIYNGYTCFGLTTDQWAQVSLGPTQVTFDLEYTIYGGSNPLATGSFSLARPINVEQDGNLGAVAVTDWHMAAAVHDSVKVQSLLLTKHGSGRESLWIEGHVAERPVALVFDIDVIDENHKRHSLHSSYALSADESMDFKNHGSSVKNFVGDSADVVLVPQNAKHTARIFEYWAERIVIKNVPVRREERQ